MTTRGVTSAFAGFRFPREVIAVAVRWYLRFARALRTGTIPAEVTTDRHLPIRGSSTS